MKNLKDCEQQTSQKIRRTYFSKDQQWRKVKKQTWNNIYYLLIRNTRGHISHHKEYKIFYLSQILQGSSKIQNPLNDQRLVWSNTTFGIPKSLATLRLIKLTKTHSLLPLGSGINLTFSMRNIKYWKLSQDPNSIMIERTKDWKDGQKPLHNRRTWMFNHILLSKQKMTILMVLKTNNQISFSFFFIQNPVGLMSWQRGRYYIIGWLNNIFRV